ncbi:glycoside hydrolase family 13 protein [Marinilabilia rubra]|uniref:Alpha-amylase n=1 Tax=Marinilabilia rubra TaxID=2162893 RepID=A0A2U2BC16_9BACT|nr:glycoside hydrolase family 13 protein [Marinilabilia rubra]PWE00615.1 alpha-amylase [Marinilabilia rubra]
MRKSGIILTLLSGLILGACQNDPKEESNLNKSTNFSDAPQWSKEVVWYQIFVETFRNGDASNDPTKEDITGAYPEFIPEKWGITPWTNDWYKPDVYAHELDGKTDNQGYPLTNFAQQQQLRRYGGDLQGVLDKIDYIDSLGVTAVYFNPLNDAPSNHKFDARNWRHIDRNFGPSPREDVKIMEGEIPDDPSTWKMTGADKLFLKVIEELHKRGIKVVMDYSWNHTGSTFWAFKDVVKNQAQSNYKDWYWIDSFDNPDTPEDEFAYKGWFGVKNLIEIKETQYVEHKSSSHVFEGNFVSESVKQHIFSVSKKWLDPNGDGDPSDGVDGFRLDVCAEVPMGFWREYRKVVRGVNPEAYLVGETWFETFPNTMMDPKSLLEGDIFDGVMNYRWYKAAREFFIGSKKAISVSAFVDSLTRITCNLRNQNILAMMNVAASHDSPRLLTSLFNKDSKYKYQVTPTAEVNYKIHKPDTEAHQTARLLLAHQFTYMGSPHIWAGDEMGMWGADMGDSRKPLIWPDYDFDPEQVHPIGRDRPVNEVKFNHEHFDYYRNLIQIREDYPVLKSGDIKYLVVDEEKRVLAYSRFDKNEEVVAVFNASFKSQTIDLKLKPQKNYKDILNIGEFVKMSGGTFQITLPQRSASIVVTDKTN